MYCADCESRACTKGGQLPDHCTSYLASEGIREDALAFYLDGENSAIVRAASLATSASIAGKWPRVRELIYFAREMGAKRIGIASCISFAAEARLLAEILESEGFEAIDAVCRIGSLTRAETGLGEVDPDHASSTACNPFMQADVLNQAQTDFNIIVGLCLGHDMLFTKRSEAWVTTLVIKDQSEKANKPAMKAFEGYVALKRQEASSAEVVGNGSAQG